MVRVVLSQWVAVRMVRVVLSQWVAVRMVRVVCHIEFIVTGGPPLFNVMIH